MFSVLIVMITLVYFIEYKEIQKIQCKKKTTLNYATIQ